MSTDTPSEPFTEEDGVLYDEEVTPQAGILGFTLRELLIVGVWLVAFVTSFFPVGWSPTLWVSGISWILPLGLPTVAVFLIVLRRFSPEGIRRVGSLGIDQFASVAFSVAVVWWAQLLWEYIASTIQAGVAPTIWVPWVQLVAMLVLVALTVFAPVFPGIRDDFRGRLVTLAHRNANPVRPVIPRPRPERPAAAVAATAAPAPLENDSVDYEASVDQEITDLGLIGSVPTSSHVSGGELGTATGVEDSDYVPGYARTPNEQTEEPAPFEETTPLDETDTSADAVIADMIGEVEDVDQTAPRETIVEQPVAQPFWALAPTERDVLDERGNPLFRIGPTAWALVIEDRGGAYVVRHDDGRVGYLHEVSDITKG
ncbi:MAG TPA: hypothetical protein DIW46_01320 [Microbacterium sp.]|uniref:hypothetical protein n=1 Tax=Microbacterium sp. TaxID=51671 RepID=UPI000ED4F6CF|nr:hypothetical protein [Microbacterium sp.]